MTRRTSALEKFSGKLEILFVNNRVIIMNLSCGRIKYKKLPRGRQGSLFQVNIVISVIVNEVIVDFSNELCNDVMSV